ncbi:iron chelate uptake ABC transporter family permease subunit [Streptomyces sp. YIM 130001]|uniref:iron chelate uptake ABC transporter family permease subunit n=1 Tax=Streptomyces sp. YIM 130001 TaxID=2259644 RepID=UPI00196943AA|nr:iron chelate uptake ABC transporter family permease subunit [Streptomyces sp. YIM 130001]
MTDSVAGGESAFDGGFDGGSAERLGAGVDTSPPRNGGGRSTRPPRAGVQFGRVGFRLRRRTVAATVVVSTALVALVLTGLFTGSYAVAPDRVLATLGGAGDRLEELVVLDHRLGRTLAGVLVGFALGCAGALTQSVTRNPIASPDILGVTAGAGFFAVLLVAVPSLADRVSDEGAGAALAPAAVVGGLVTTLVILALSWRSGFDGMRLILVGLSINSLALAGVSWLLTRADLDQAQVATRWLTGSLNGTRLVGTAALVPLVIVGAVVCVALARDLGALRLGRDMSAALGTSAGRTSVVSLVVAVVLVAGATAVAGPVPFVAFAAPQVAMRAFGTPGPPPIAAGLTGALLVLGADLGVQHLPVELPVGVATAAVGAPYLLSSCNANAGEKVPEDACPHDKAARVDPTPASDSPLSARHITAGYGRKTVIGDLSVDIPRGQVTTIIGSNGCGKSTLLKVLARLLAPSQGQVLLQGEPLDGLRPREVARRMAILPQSPVAPESMTVRDLAARGRQPHQPWYRGWSEEDDRIATDAMLATGVLELADRPLEDLSGGQRQRAWVAMALAQETDILLLDEPTTHLDPAHCVEILELVVRLRRETGRTIVMVLHDLSLAARYSDHLMVMKDGALIAEGPPAGTLTSELLLEGFGFPAHVFADPYDGLPTVVPRSRAGADPGASGRERGGRERGGCPEQDAKTPSPEAARPA